MWTNKTSVPDDVTIATTDSTFATVGVEEEADDEEEAYLEGSERLIQDMSISSDNCEESFIHNNARVNAAPVALSRVKWFIPLISISNALLDAIAATIVLWNEPLEAPLLNVVAVFMVMLLVTLLFITFFGFLQEGRMDCRSKSIEIFFFSVLGIGALVNLPFIRVRLASFPFSPLATVMDGIWCLRLISHVETPYEYSSWVFLTRAVIRVYLASNISSFTTTPLSVYFALIFVNGVWRVRKERFETIMTQRDGSV
jgi:hypothetical protein